jgi:hypothetical protein
MAKPREPKSVQFNLRLRPSMKGALEKAAADDNRSVTSLIEIALTEWLKAKGYAPEPPKPPPAPARRRKAEAAGELLATA